MARKPRYIELAALLRKAIAGKKYKIGAQLPTEHQLCEQHGVSRHTARAALQVLDDDGLIERRPGLGTTVIGTGDASSFTQPLGGLDDLLQYAHEARLKTNATETITLTPALARRLGAKRGSKWLALHGVRVVNGEAIAATTIYVSDVVGAKVSDFKNAAKAITEHIEKRYGVSVAGITQTITADTMHKNDAASLGAIVDQPVLRTTRRYFDAAERLFVISDTRHPSDRFKYEMTYKRTSTTRYCRCDEAHRFRPVRILAS